MSKELKKKKIKVVFMGTPDFAVPGLKSLIEDNSFEISAVFTKPDKAKGRKKIVSPPPIKTVAEKNNIQIFQPEKIKNEVNNIKDINPDLIVVIAYGKIIPQEILDIPKHGCINVHASLLPKYRGASCLNAPIVNGDNKTGITIMKMDAGMDTGPILKQFEITLTPNTTLPQLHDKLANISAETLPKTLKEWIEGKITPEEQNNNEATYVKMIKKEDGKINWNKSAEEIERLIRGMNPWPGTFTKNEDGKTIKIKEALLEKDNNDLNKKIGELYIKNDKLAVKCGQNSLIILKLQTEGGKVLPASEFLKGHSDIIGQILK